MAPPRAQPLPSPRHPRCFTESFSYQLQSSPRRGARRPHPTAPSTAILLQIRRNSNSRARSGRRDPRRWGGAKGSRAPRRARRPRPSQALMGTRPVPEAKPSPLRGIDGHFYARGHEPWRECAAPAAAPWGFGCVYLHKRARAVRAGWVRRDLIAQLSRGGEEVASGRDCSIPGKRDRTGGGVSGQSATREDLRCRGGVRSSAGLPPGCSRRRGKGATGRGALLPLCPGVGSTGGRPVGQASLRRPGTVGSDCGGWTPTSPPFGGPWGSSCAPGLRRSRGGACEARTCPGARGM